MKLKDLKEHGCSPSTMDEAIFRCHYDMSEDDFDALSISKLERMGEPLKVYAKFDKKSDEQMGMSTVFNLEHPIELLERVSVRRMTVGDVKAARNVRNPYQKVVTLLTRVAGCDASVVGELHVSDVFHIMDVASDDDDEEDRE